LTLPEGFVCRLICFIPLPVLVIDFISDCAWRIAACEILPFLPVEKF
jgi:hypothetical protein